MAAGAEPPHLAPPTSTTASANAPGTSSDKLWPVPRGTPTESPVGVFAADA
jgi:hypothetical protein